MTSPTEDSSPRRGLLRRLFGRGPTRRDLLSAGALAVGAAAIASPHPHTHRPNFPGDLGPHLPKLRAFRQRLSQNIRGLLMGSAGVQMLAREPDHAGARHIYTVEVAQLMEHFANNRDLEPYLLLRKFAVEELVIDDPSDPFTQGFVLWRRTPGGKPDASGTTEMLRVARALWRGADAFNRPDDRTLAVRIVEAYARHAGTQADIWLIHNYFAFATRSFATNTFVIDYDADFVREVADWHAGKTGQEKRYDALDDLARKSYALMRQTPSPCGLLYDLVQPELKTMYWGVEVSFFSPNDVIQSNNACSTAMTVARGEPAVARGVLNFLVRRLHSTGKLHKYYYGRTGEPVKAWGLGPAEYMSAAVLALRLDDRSAVEMFVQQGGGFWEGFVGRTPGDLQTLSSWAWTASELLIGFDELLATPKTA